MRVLCAEEIENVSGAGLDNFFDVLGDSIAKLTTGITESVFELTKTISNSVNDLTKDIKDNPGRYHITTYPNGGVVITSGLGIN